MAKRNPYRMMWHVMWSGTANIVLFWMMLRRFGFSTDWARIKHICMTGEYRQLLEPGSSPDNVHLPPHLRLDVTSYLDLPTTKITPPPWVDIKIKPEEIMFTIDDIKRQENKLEPRDTIYGGGSSKVAWGQLVMTANEYERYVKRRLGMPKPDNDKEGGDVKSMSEIERVLDAEAAKVKAAKDKVAMEELEGKGIPATSPLNFTRTS